ncbi:methyltransferase domain-containing protein, partial [Candidatus Woesearchaeota archaeon]|nr:methyltransferase domain-containing protein [Candidatus Woesearchaeota archaeon]
MEEIDRKLFVPEEFQNEAYYDGPLQIGREATISQPATVAFMLDHLNVRSGQKVLEIGVGSGWVAALIGHLVGKSGSVYGLEIDADLTREAQNRIQQLALDHVVILHYDGSRGYPPEAPYDRIMISAACPPVPKTLFDQLKTPGILV